MNQLTYKHLAAALFVAFAGAASAQQSMTVTSTGTITPGACAISIAGGANFDHGNIGAASVLALPETPWQGVTYGLLPMLASKTLTVTCGAPAKVRLAVVDNSSSSAAAGGGFAKDMFGLGLAGTKQIGFISMVADQYMVDGQAQAAALLSFDAGNTWASSNTAWLGNRLMPASSVSFIKSSENTTPDAITTASLNLTPLTFIDKALPMTTGVQLAGSITFSLTYL